MTVPNAVKQGNAVPNAGFIQKAFRQRLRIRYRLRLSLIFDKSRDISLRSAGTVGKQVPFARDGEELVIGGDQPRDADISSLAGACGNHLFHRRLFVARGEGKHRDRLSIGCVKTIPRADQIPRGIHLCFPDGAARFVRRSLDNRFAGEVNAVVAQHRPLASCADVDVTRLEIEPAEFVFPFVPEKGIVVREDRRAPRLAVFRELEVQKFAGAAIETSRDRAAAGDEQLVARGGQRSLWRNAGERGVIMRLVDVLGARAVIHPGDAAGFGIERVNECPHKGPDAGGEINRVVEQHWTAARGPSRNHPFVSEQFPIGRPTAKFPNLFTSLGIQAIQVTVVTGEPDFSVGCYRRQANRAVSIKPPAFVAGAGVEGNKLVGIVIGQKQGFAQDDRLEDFVVGHQVLIERIVPDRHARRVLSRPDQVDLGGKIGRGGSCPAGVIPPHRPIGGKCRLELAGEYKRRYENRPQQSAAHCSETLLICEYRRPLRSALRPSSQYTR